jgi:hypothetical protein
MSESSDGGLLRCFCALLDAGADFEEPDFAERDVRGIRGVVGLRPPGI